MHLRKCIHAFQGRRQSLVSFIFIPSTFRCTPEFDINISNFRLLMSTDIDLICSVRVQNNDLDLMHPLTLMNMCVGPMDAIG